REVRDGESVPVERPVWLLLILVETDVDEGEVVHRERERYEPLGERIVLWKNFAHLKGEIADHAHRNHSNPRGTLAQRRLSGVNASRGGWNGWDWSRVPTWQSD